MAVRYYVEPDEAVARRIFDREHDASVARQRRFHDLAEKAEARGDRYELGYYRAAAGAEHKVRAVLLGLFCRVEEVTEDES